MTRSAYTTVVAVIVALMSPPIAVQAEQGTETATEAASSAASEGVVEEVVETSDVPPEDEISVASDVCPPTSVGDSAPEGSSKFSGKVYKNFDKNAPFANVKVTIYDGNSYDGATSSYTRVLCRTTADDGYAELMVPNTWPADLSLYVVPPEGSTFSRPSGDVPFSTLHLPANRTHFVQNISLGGGSCPQGQGVAIPTATSSALNDPFDMISISGTVTTAASSVPKALIVVNPDFGSVCAITMGGPYSVSIPRYWAQEGFKSGGSLLVMAKPLSGSEGSTGGVVYFDTAESLTGQDFSFGPPGFTVNVVLNGGSTSVGNYSAVFCVLDTTVTDFSDPSDLYGPPTRCTTGSPAQNADFPGGVISGSITYENGDTDLAPTYWRYILNGPNGEERSQWLSLDGAAPHVVNQSISTAVNNPGDGAVGGGGGSYFDSPCADGQTPTIAGSVTDGQSGYETTVSLWVSGDTRFEPDASPLAWLDSFGWKTVTTSAQGYFEMCLDKAEFGDTRVGQIIAHSGDRGPTATFGDTGGEIFEWTSVPVSTSAQTLTIAPIVMVPPTVRGTVTESAFVRVVQVEASGEKSNIALVLTTGGDFATSIPVPSSGGISYYVQAEGFGQNPVAPYLEEFAGATPQSPFTVSSGATVRSPNIVAEIRDGSGNPITDRYFNFTVTEIGCETLCIRPGVVTFSNTKMVTYLEAGQWQVEARCWSYGCPFATTTGTISVVNSGSGPVVDSSSLPSWSGTSPNFTFQASTGAIKFRVLDNAGANYSATVSVRVNEVRSNGNYSWPDEQAVTQQESFGWSPGAGRYRLSLVPIDPLSNLAETDVYVETDGTTLTNLCSVTVVDGRDSVSCATSISAANDGFFEFTLQVANFRAVVCAPPVGQNQCPEPAHPTNSWAKAMLEVDQILVSENSVQQSRLKSVEITGNTAKLRIDPPQNGGLYRLKFSPPWGNPNLWAAVEELVFVKNDGTWWRCSDQLNPQPCVVSTDENPDPGRTEFAAYQDGVGYDAATSVLHYETVEFRIAPIVGTVVDPNGNPVRDTWVELQKEITDAWGNTYFQWIGGAPTNPYGKFGFSAQAGRYRVRANPPWSNPAGFADGAAEFDVDSSGAIIPSATNSALVDVNGTLEVRVALRNPNVVGRITAGGLIREFAGVSVEERVGDSAEWQWRPIWGNTDESGTFRMFLDDGTWRLTAWPRGSDAELFVEGRIEIVVSGSAIASLDGVTCGSGESEVDCSTFDLAYGTPNLTGIISDGTQPVPNVGVGIERWNPSLERFVWNSWTNGSSTGRYSANLADGLYRLGFNPPRSNTAVVRTNRFALVDEAVACLFTSENEAKAALIVAATADGCSSEGASSILHVALSGPNVQGRVVNNAGAGQRAWVRAEIWNGQYFEWQDQWAEANNSGDFSFNLSDTSSVFGTHAIHRLTGEPRSGSGLSQGVSYVSVSASGMEPWCVDSFGTPADSCSALSLVSGRVPVLLPGSNLIGQATFQSTPVNRGWVEVFKVVGSSLQWKTSSGLDGSGLFSLRLEADGADLWTRYRVIVNPDPWANPFNLSKKRIDVWVGDSNDSDSVRDEICLTADGFSDGSAESTCSSWVTNSASNPLAVAMSNGNLAGYVVEPNCTSGCYVNQAELSLQRWVSTSATTGYWQWTDNWARTSSNGAYSLQIDEAGDYRLTARPPWGTSTFSPNSVEFTWAEASVSATNYMMFQHIRLSQPNASVIITNGSDPVPNAWIGVERKVTNGQWSWWEWTGLGTGTATNGRASLNIANTSGGNEEYRLVVYPPWNNTVNLSRFTQLIKVRPNQNVTAWDGTGTLSGTDGESPLTTLQFPTANLVLTIKDSSAANVRDSWVFVEEYDSVGNYWRWIDIAGGTNSQGRVALTVLADGRYRVVVNPPWNRPSLPRFSREFVKAGASFDWDLVTEGVQNLSGNELPFPSANVFGTVYVSDGVRNTFSWIDVRTEDGTQHVTGTHTDASGQYSLALPVGTYSVWFHGNPSQTTVPPTNVMVTVSATSIASWTYSNGGGGCPESGTCTLDPVLERTPPNLEVLVTLGGSPQRGAFLRLTDSTGARFDFVTNASGRVLTYLTPGTVTVSALFVGADGTSYTGSGVLVSADFGGSPLDTVTIPIGVPTAPSAVSAVATSQGGELAISWEAATARGGAITGYRAEVLSDSSKFCTADPSATSCVISGLLAGTYSIIVRAQSGIGDSPSSNSVSGTPLSP